MWVRTSPLPRVRSHRNLDADISFGPDQFEFLLQKLIEDPSLGVTGTAYSEEGFDSTKDSFESENSVHGACQVSAPVLQ